jgi:hypothetical protein
MALDEMDAAYTGECLACDDFGPLDDQGLCNVCGPKLERDLIRLRDWDYTVSAFGLSPQEREKLRRQIIKTHGKDLELITADARSKQGNKPGSKRRKRR